MKPQTMLEYVLKKTNEITNEWSADDQIRLLDEISNYAQFLSQKPEKWMFVPTDYEGNILEEPTIKKGYWMSEKEKYQQALDRVIFEGFEKTNCGGFDVEKDYKLFKLKEFNTIEQLINRYGKYLTFKKPIL